MEQKKTYRKGQFTPGKSGNPHGRPKGVPSKNLEEIRNFLQLVLERNLPRLESDLDAMSPTSRWMVLDKLSGKFLPNLTQAEVSGIVDGEIRIKVDFSPVQSPVQDLEGVEPKSIEDSTSLDFTDVIIPEVTDLATKTEGKEDKDSG